MKNVKSAKNKRSLNLAGPVVSPPTKEEIATLAYSIWEREGCPDDCDREHWLKAELEIPPTRHHPSTTSILSNLESYHQTT